jgi:RND family efflux transporter MFP subunit
MRKIIAFVMLITLAAGCNNSGKDLPAAEQATRVKTAAVQSVTDAVNLTYSGTVEAAQVIPLSFRTTGTVTKIYVEVGDPVKKGQVLASLDNADLQSIYNTTLAKYQQAEDAYNRLKQVHDEGSLPDIKWVEMKSSFEQAKSALDLSKNNLDKCILVAPVSGIVGRRNIEPGQSSINLTGAPIELVRIETVMVKISVPENEINKIRDGQEAGISVSALGGKIYTGNVTNVSPVAELMSRTYTVKITVENTGLDMKPGMVCDVSMNLGGTGAMLIVPKKAVSRESNGKTYVFVVNPGINVVSKQYVKVGNYHDSGIEILDGLHDGQIVVCEGGEKLSENSKIIL